MNNKDKNKTWKSMYKINQNETNKKAQTEIYDVTSEVDLV